MASSPLYILVGLNDAQLERLDDAKLSYSTEQVIAPTKPGKFWGLFSSSSAETPSTGYVLDAEAYAAALDYLGATEVELQPAGAENTFFPRLKFDREPRPVLSVYSWFNEVAAQGTAPRSDAFEQIVRDTILPQSERDVLLHVSGTPGLRKPQPDGLLHLYICATASVHTRLVKLERRVLFRTTLTSSISFYEPSGLGVIFYDDDLQPVGELIGKDEIYCLVDFIRSGNAAELQVFRRFCEEVNALLHLSPDEREERHLQAKRTEEANRRELYIQHCSIRADRDLISARERLQAAEAAVLAQQAAYTAALNRVENEQRLVEALETDVDLRHQALAVEFERFHNDPKFVRVVPFESGVRVYTRTLYCFSKHRKEVRRLGEMRIEILLDPGAASSPVRFYNISRQLTREGIDQPHPHVTPDGLPCLGNSSALFHELVQSRELYNAAAYALQYLESVNSSPPRWEEWPLVGQAERAELRKKGLLPVGA